MANIDIDQPIIVKKIKKGGHAHHGGAWKVAYADFVTAMMAFFLLLWLLNATTEEQKSGLADYFSPASVSSPSSGSGGVLGGQSISVEGNRVSAGGPSEGGVTLPIPPDLRTPTEEQGEETDPEKTEPKTADDPSDKPSDELTKEELAELLAEQEQEQFEAAEEALLDAIESVPEMEALQDNLIIEQTPEGLRIQLIDKNGISMFASGSTEPNEQLQKLIGLVAQVIAQLPNKLSISGHTDSTPFRSDNGYGNWELSSDRANAARRLLTQAGVEQERVADVQGRAATEPLIQEDTTDPANRRISIILLRENKLPLQAGRSPDPEFIGDTEAKSKQKKSENRTLPAAKPGELPDDARLRHLERQG